MLGIRVDANKEIATGHVMRCLSIAIGLKSVGIDCIFITSDEFAIQIVAYHGYEVISLNSQSRELDKETKRLVEVIQEYKIDKLIIDSYYVTAQYLERLMVYTSVIYVDDMNFFKYPVSMVINYNVYYEIFSYPEIYKGTKTLLLLGCRYAPLREEFKSVKPSSREMVKKILVTTGGTDQYNLAGKLISRIIDEDFFQGTELHVVVGSLNSNYDYLKGLSNGCHSIVLHQNVKAMSKLMISCDIAITAGGLTMYELCACGVPTISFSFADNQLYGVEGFSREGIMAYAGDVRINEEECIYNLIAYIKKYIASPKVRREKAINMREKVDGNGVSRIVKAIVNLC